LQRVKTVRIAREGKLWSFLAMSDEPDRPYTPKEAALKARVNLKTLYQGIHAGTVPAFRVSKVFRIPRHAFDAMLKNGKIGGDGKAA
jgi:excisionase family DNA binding protein